MARKNIHGKRGVKFKAGFTASKKKNMMRNLVTELFKFGHVEVTEKVAFDLKILADEMITFAKKGDLHSRRQASRVIRDIYVDETGKVTVLQKLFDEIAPKYKERNGGYTRALKVQNRRGDNSPMCLVELV
ncbi:MAG: 50S ribosomal protein L17 [Bacilli bacterium]|jgi:large subunit ribosomal protein L17|nr:50S ribosomal protein L17 [Bacilli bacterium]MDD4584553.1 50S ribosomal protein L17 [Bacilli bacterium]